MQTKGDDSVNCARRALLSVMRRSGKSALLMAIIFILGVVIAGAASVQQALRNTKSALAQKIGITAEVKMAGVSIIQEMMITEPDLKVEALTKDVIDAIGGTSQVRSYDYTAQIPMTYQLGDVPAAFTLNCRKDPDFTELQEGTIKISRGRGLTEEDRQSKRNPILISKATADRLNITTGSQIQLQRNIIYGHDVKETLKYTFTVVGLFEDVAPVADDTGKTAAKINNDANCYILMDNAAGMIADINSAESRINGMNATWVTVNPSFVLRTREDVEGFNRVVEALAPRYYTVSNNIETFDYMISPTSNMEWIAQVTMMAAAFAAIAILSPVVTLSIRDRRAEMGTYFSIGERRSRIAAQILLEIVAVAVVGLSAALFAGNGVAAAVSGQLLKNEVVSVTEAEKKRVVNTGTVDSQMIMDSYRVTLGPDTVVIFYGVGLLTATLAGVAPVLYTLRLNPKKILLM